MSNNPVFLKSYICKKYIDYICKKNKDKKKIAFNSKHILSDLGLNDVDPNLIDKWKKQLEFYYNISECIKKPASKRKVEKLLSSITNDNIKNLITKMTEDAIERYKDLDQVKDSSDSYLNEYMKSKKSLKFDVDTYCGVYPKSCVNLQSSV